MQWKAIECEDAALKGNNHENKSHIGSLKVWQAWESIPCPLLPLSVDQNAIVDLLDGMITAYYYIQYYLIIHSYDDDDDDDDDTH